MGSLRLPACTHDPVGGNRLGLALDPERPERLDLGRAAEEREGRLTDQYLARRRGLLEPLGDHDRVTGDKPVALGRIAGDDDLARC